VRRFVDNLRVAIAQRGLRIPADPEEARATLFAVRAGNVFSG